MRRGVEAVFCVRGWPETLYSISRNDNSQKQSIVFYNAKWLAESSKPKESREAMLEPILVFFGSHLGPSQGLMLGRCFVVQTPEPLKTSRKKSLFARACPDVPGALILKHEIARQPNVLRVEIACRSPFEPLLVRRGARNLILYDTKRRGDFSRACAAKRGESRPAGGSAL